jgi:hypothetical protein
VDGRIILKRILGKCGEFGLDSSGSGLGPLAVVNTVMNLRVP